MHIEEPVLIKRVNDLRKDTHDQDLDECLKSTVDDKMLTKLWYFSFYF